MQDLCIGQNQLDLENFPDHLLCILSRIRLFLKQKHQASEQKARRGSKMKPGDAVRTEAGAYAKITMSDKNVIHVGPDSQMVLTAYQSPEEAGGGTSDSHLSVLYGKVRTALEQKYDGKKSRFRVTTEAAVLGVRGTDFVTEHSDVSHQTRAITLEGLVGIAGVDSAGQALDEKPLDAGQMTLVQMGEAPLEPIELPKDLLEEISQGSAANKQSSSLQQKGQERLNQEVAKVEINATDINQPPEVHPNEFFERNIISSGFQGGGDASVNITVEHDPGS